MAEYYRNTTPNIQYYNGSPYEVKGSLLGYGITSDHWNPNPGAINPKIFQSLVNRGVLTPYQQPQSSAQQKQPSSMTGNFPSALGNQFNHLSQQASDALYGGILGYQPKPITSPTGNQYQPPTNQGFQFPFGLLNRNFMPGY